jgi:dextranase
MRLIPRRATFAPTEPVEVDILDAAGDVTVRLCHLDRQIGVAVLASGENLFRADGLPVGGYGLEATDGGGTTAGTAVDVLADPFLRPRYGFVADYPAGHEPDELVGTVRELHLNMIQFYDWAHRYAHLVPDTDDYLDPLGRRLSLTTVRGMTAALAGVGALSLGYAAVYAVGGADWPDWQDTALVHADGEPHRFTDDLLLLVDPANPRWMAHFAGDLRQAMAEVGFAGFHLDSYGWPKRAFRVDGSVCDLADAFPELLSHVRDSVPDGVWMFNNVNDFPTYTTAGGAQQATYVEVWNPHTTLGDLGALAMRARAFGPDRPPILAAYLPHYAEADPVRSDAGAALVMATIVSHGASHLLVGEGGRVLIDPYYPRNFLPSEDSQDRRRRWYDFQVRYGDLFYAGHGVEVTRSFTGGINEDLVLVAPDKAMVSTEAVAGSVWIRVVRVDDGLVVHLINLTAADETAWALPKDPPAPLEGLQLRFLQTLAVDDVLVADPDREPALQPVGVVADGRYSVAVLPTLGTWQVVFLRFREA